MIKWILLIRGQIFYSMRFNTSPLLPFFKRGMKQIGAFEALCIHWLLCQIMNWSGSNAALILYGSKAPLWCIVQKPHTTTIGSNWIENLGFTTAFQAFLPLVPWVFGMELNITKRTRSTNVLRLSSSSKDGQPFSQMLLTSNMTGATSLLGYV